MRNTNLYFGLSAAPTMAFSNHTAQTLQLTTGGFNNPFPKGVNFITNGGLKVTVVANNPGTVAASQRFGSGYGTVTAGDVVDITKACTIHATSGLITIATAGEFGHTISSTGTENDFTVTGLKPFATGHGIVYNSSKLVGVAISGAATTALNFVDCGGAEHTADTVTITQGSNNKQKDFIAALMDVVADDNKVSGLVVVRDDMRDISLANHANPATAVA